MRSRSLADDVGVTAGSDPGQPDALEAILDELRAIRRLLEGRAQGAAPVSVKPAHARLLAAIVDNQNGLDLPFEASEMFDAQRHDAELAAALEALHITTVASLGALFRSLNGRTLDGRRLVRDGRRWLIELCT